MRSSKDRSSEDTRIQISTTFTYNTFAHDAEPPPSSGYWYYYERAKTITKHVVGISVAGMTTAPISMFALSGALGVVPYRLKEAWAAASWFDRAKCVAFGSASMISGVLIRYPVYFQHLLYTMYRIKEQSQESKLALVRNLLIVGASLYTGVAALSLGYYAMLWISVAAAFFSAIDNFLFTTAMRLITITDLYEWMCDNISADHRLQKILAEQIKTIKPEYLEQCKVFWEGKEIDENNAFEFLCKLFQHAQEEIGNISIFKTSSAKDKVIDYLKYASQIGIGASLGATFSIFYCHFGMDAIEIACKKVREDCQDESVQRNIFLISLLPALASFPFGFMPGVRCLDRIFDFAHCLYEKPSLLIKGAPITLMCALSSASMYSAVVEIAENENIFHISYEDISGPVFVSLGVTLGFLFEWSGLTQRFIFLDKTPSDAEKVSTWLEKNKLKPEDIQALREKGMTQNGFFSPPKLTKISNNVEQYKKPSMRGS